MEPISTERLGGRFGSCRFCDARPITSFNWRVADGPRFAELLAIRSRLAREATLKWGTLLRCPECRQAWYLDGDGATATRVLAADEPLLRQWSRAPITLSESHLAVLSRIRAAGPDVYGNGRGYLTFPCAIRWSDGSLSDPAVLVVTTHPPVEGPSGRQRLFDPAAVILESEYALPLDVRLETRQADELRMGFAPTAVEDGAGRLFLLNGSADVFDHGEAKGRDIRLTSRSWSMDTLPPIASPPSGRVTYVFADRPSGVQF
jgi:hypothetical protein